MARYLVMLDLSAASDIDEILLCRLETVAVAWFRSDPDGDVMVSDILSAVVFMFCLEYSKIDILASVAHSRETWCATIT